MQPDKLAGKVLGHYHIRRPLGYGGMATVFLAEDTNLQREVAIKVFQPRIEGEKEDFLRRFAREARVLAKLDHPNILPVYDYGEEGELAYLVMPHLEGGSLRDYLQRYTAITPQEAVELINSILKALHYAHTRGLIHRDIKPGNMLFKADGTLLLSDFGLVKVLPIDGNSLLNGSTGSITQNSISGTPDYMAPEQIKGEAIPATDVYAIGIVLYEMLTGTRPFLAENYLGLLIKHTYEVPRPLRLLNPSITPELEAIVLHALEKDPARRYQSAEEFRLALLQSTGIERFTINLQESGNSEYGRPFFPQPLSKQIAYEEDTRIVLSPQLAIPVTPSTRTQANSQRTTNNTYNNGQPFPKNDYATIDINGTTSGKQSVLHVKQIIQQPARKQRSHIPLITTLILLPLLILTSAGGILYSQGLFPFQLKKDVHVLFHRNNNTPVPPTAFVPDGVPKVTVPMSPQLNISCPAAETARAANIKPLVLGQNQNLVYSVNEVDATNNPTFGTIKRRNINSIRKGVEVLKMPNIAISNAEISNDGQWVLFTARVEMHEELRLLRMDGNGLQTLFCTPDQAMLLSPQWSFDQRSILFTQDTANGKSETYLLDIKRGQVQRELISTEKPGESLSFTPRVWLDPTHIYVTGLLSKSATPLQNIYILNTQKGPNQHEGDLQKIISETSECTSFDTSYNFDSLFVSTCSPEGDQMSAHGIITRQATAGGPITPILNNSDLAITTVRAISETTLLFMVGRKNGDISQNGLWKVNTDGTGLLRISTDPGYDQALCTFSQYAWSNVSRDHKQFALQTYTSDTHRYQIAVGTLADGKLDDAFADIRDGTSMRIIGWTTMN